MYCSTAVISPTFCLVPLPRPSADRVVWNALFHRLPLERADGEVRRAEGCGGINWVTCTSCGRAVPVEIHCGASVACPDCAQHRYVVAALRFRDSIQGRLDMNMQMYVLEAPIARTTSYDDAKAIEGGIHTTIVCDADVEFLRVILPDKITYTAFRPSPSTARPRWPCGRTVCG